MRIAHVTATFPPIWSGTGNVCYNNSKELIRRGHEVHVYTVTMEDAPSEEMMEGVYVHRLKPFISFGNAALLPGLIHLKGFDLIHFHFPFFGAELTCLAARIRNLPIVITYHQDVHLSGFLGFVENFLRFTVTRWVLNNANRVLFTSLDYSHASYARRLMRGNENSIGELSNGTDPHHFSRGDLDPEFVSSICPGGVEKIVLLVAGLDSAHYFKGIPAFLEAIAVLPENVRGVVVGEGNLKNEYEEIARRLNLNERVLFPGRVSHELLPKYYQIADVAVLPSLTMGEAFGLVLVESLACETPVIASNLPGVRTVVDDGLDGYLVEPGNVKDLADKLRMILDLPEEERKRMGARGREKVLQKYTWERAGERLEEIYQDVLSETKAEAAG